MNVEGYRKRSITLQNLFLNQALLFFILFKKNIAIAEFVYPFFKNNCYGREY